MPVDPRFQRGIDLVTYIRASPEYSAAFCVGVAGYPDGHPDVDMSEDDEINHLKAKVDAGADFIITQLFYDVDRFLVWLQKLRDKGLFRPLLYGLGLMRTLGITVPVIPGIMPIQTYASFQRLTKLCGAELPSSVLEDLDRIKVGVFRHYDRVTNCFTAR